MFDDSELVELSTWNYERRGRPREEGAFAWEEPWLAALADAPLSVLVGGAGYGRECRFLCERDHRVWAYEPSAEAAAVCSRDAPCAVGTHQDLARAVNGRSGPLVELAGRRYDAVWLGWGSFSHVLDPTERRDVIAACARLTDGPVFVSARVGALARGQTAERWATIGERLARRLGGRPPPRGLSYQPQVGFAATIRTDELEDIARAIDRNLTSEPNPGIAAVTFCAPKRS